MAILDINNHATASSLLFERLPDRLFAPLASSNRHRYWSLLCRLHEKRFGPDAPLPPSRGYPTKLIVQDIIEALEFEDVWDNEDAADVGNTQIEVRAYAVFNRFYECGWFRIEQPRFEKKVTMQPAVSQFLTMLISFAETGPVFVSGKIRSIDANLQMVIDGNATGDSLTEAAEQARNLLEHVRNTGTNIRDLMESLHQNISTAQYVQQFFSGYIERVFIGDYRELRTTEHPLSKRAQILTRIEDIRESQAHRQRLITWYENKRTPGDIQKAERLFERDLNRLSELQRIDEYLDRLDDEIRRANKRALAFLDYRLRSLRPTDTMIKLAITSVIEQGVPLMADPFPPSEMISEDRLAEPRKAIERAAPSVLRKVVVSDEQIARSRIMLRARANRTVTFLGLSTYAKTQLEGKDSLNSDELVINSISDVRMYQALSTLSLQMSASSRKMQMDAIGMTRGFRVEINGDLETPHPHISSLPFKISARNAGKK
jgi:tetratricopeptide (TPR) repeat protein